jgi:hypothetical protein
LSSTFKIFAACQNGNIKGKATNQCSKDEKGANIAFVKETHFLLLLLLLPLLPLLSFDR